MDERSRGRSLFSGHASASWSWDLLYFKGWRLAVGGGWWRLAAVGRVIGGSCLGPGSPRTPGWGCPTGVRIVQEFADYQKKCPMPTPILKDHILTTIQNAGAVRSCGGRPPGVPRFGSRSDPSACAAPAL